MNSKVTPLVALRAAVLREAGRPLRIEKLEMEGPRADEVLVRIVASGICHTDIDCCDSGGSGPVVLGHEGAGVVERVGQKVHGLKPGDHVVLSYLSCGRCRPCRAGHPADCDHFWEANFGFARLDGSNALERSGVRGHFFGQSSFAIYALATARNVVKVSKSLPLSLLAPLGCGLQTGAGTVMNSLAVKRGSSIAMFGSGAVGLAAVMAARIVGARTIIAVDLRPHRLKLALELGATHTIDTRHADLERSIAAITGEGVDYIVESTGDWQLHETAINVLNPHGKMAILTGGSKAGLPGGRKVLSVIQGDAVPQQFIPRLIRLYAKGQFPFDRLVKFYPFRQINRALADAKRGCAIKPVLLMGET